MSCKQPLCSIMRLRAELKYLIILILNGIILWWGIFASAHWLFIILILTWVNMMLYSYSRIGKRVLLFAFGVTFFVFLIGREFLEQYLHYPISDHFTKEVTAHTYLSIWLALISVWGSFSLFSSLKSRTRRKYRDSYYFAPKIRFYSKLVFWFTYPFAIIFNLVIAFFVAKVGYLAYYTEFSGFISQVPYLYVLSKIELMTSAAFCVFLSTLPPKEDFKIPCRAYIIYILLSLGSGQRSGFLLGLMILFVFVNFMQEIRPEEKWFDKRYMRYVVLAVPVIAVAGSLFNSWRFEESENDVKFLDVFFRFFYEQGVSSYVVKRAYELENEIPGGVLYCLEFLHSGIPARILGIEVYNGNTVEHALYGNSFTHALGYTVLGKNYLNGAGTGSSYIAELYYDFGYIGIILGSILYGWMFSLFTKGAESSIFKRALLFIIITKLLWAPRGAYTAFISFICAPSTILMLLFIFGMAHIKTNRTPLLAGHGTK